MRIDILTLNILLHPGDIPAFRGCIAEIVGRDQELFHNHDNALNAKRHYHWDYPLIQYAVRRQKATIMGIGKGAEVLRKVLVPKLPDQLQFAGRTHSLLDWQMKGQEYQYRILDTPQQYGLYGWLALNHSNYRDWKSTTLAEARRIVLERALTGHLRVLAKTLGVQELDQVIGYVLQVDNQKRVQFLGTQFVRFHALISSTLVLPTGIGIGRSAAFGFGEVQPIHVYQNIIKHQSGTIAL